MTRLLPILAAITRRIRIPFDPEPPSLTSTFLSALAIVALYVAVLIYTGRVDAQQPPRPDGISCTVEVLSAPHERETVKLWEAL